MKKLVNIKQQLTQKMEKELGLNSEKTENNFNGIELN